MAYTMDNWRMFMAVLEPGDAFVLGAYLILAVLTLILELISLRFNGEPYAAFRRPLALFLMVVMIVLLAPSEDNDFIYFAF